MVGWYQLWLEQSVPFGRIGDYRVSATEPTALWKPENQKNFLYAVSAYGTDLVLF